jgi:hypothetical protein
MSASRLVYPQKRTFAGSHLMSALANKRHSGIYSITSSASDKNDSGIVRPSALAVLRLRTSSNLVGCSTGRSAGEAPRRMENLVDVRSGLSIQIFYIWPVAH